MAPPCVAEHGRVPLWCSVLKAVLFEHGRKAQKAFSVFVSFVFQYRIWASFELDITCCLIGQVSCKAATHGHLICSDAEPSDESAENMTAVMFELLPERTRCKRIWR